MKLVEAFADQAAIAIAGPWSAPTLGRAAPATMSGISGFEEWTIGADGLIANSDGQFDAAEYQRQLEGGVE